MANLDSRSKRASAVGIGLAWLLAPVLPDGSFQTQDRAHTAWSYSEGVDVTVPTPVETPAPAGSSGEGCAGSLVAAVAGDC